MPPRGYINHEALAWWWEHYVHLSRRAFGFCGPPTYHGYLNKIERHKCVSKVCHHSFRSWLVAFSVTCHYLNKCWYIINGSPGNIFQGTLNRNTTAFIEENEFWKLRLQTGADFVSESLLKVHWVSGIIWYMWEISCLKLDHAWYDITQFIIVTVVFCISCFIRDCSKKYFDYYMFVNTNRLCRKLHSLPMDMSLLSHLS